MVLRSQDRACKVQGWCKWAQLRRMEDRLVFHKRMSALRSLRLGTHRMVKALHMILEALRKPGLVVTHTHPFPPHMLVLQVCTRAQVCRMAGACSSVWVYILAYIGALAYIWVYIVVSACRMVGGVCRLASAWAYTWA